MILNSRLACSEHLNLAVLHKAQARVLVPMEFMLRARWPFEVECKCPGWVAEMTGLCNGERTGEQVMNLLMERGTIDPDTPSSEFAEVLRTLISSGFLELESRPIPVWISRSDAVRAGCPERRVCATLPPLGCPWVNESKRPFWGVRVAAHDLHVERDAGRSARCARRVSLFHRF
jgi:hypothetical protein